jgi:hypothetical protein
MYGNMKMLHPTQALTCHLRLIAFTGLIILVASMLGCSKEENKKAVVQSQTAPAPPEQGLKQLGTMLLSPDYVVVDDDGRFLIPQETRRELARVLVGSRVERGGITPQGPDGLYMPRPGCQLFVLRQADVSGQKINLKTMDNEDALWVICVFNKFEFAHVYPKRSGKEEYRLFNKEWSAVVRDVRKLRDANEKSS